MARYYLFLTAGAAVLAVTSPAMAQSAPATSPPAPTPEAGVPDIVVTAQKRSESVQKVPIAVTAIGGASLQQRASTNLSDIGQDVPGFNVSQQVGQARLTLRGIGVDNLSAGAETSVAFNQDGVYYSRSAAALASFYDVDRVEVLRGPQGTLYGRNATGGSVNIITNRPTDTFHAGVEVTGGNYGTINSEGYINGPISDNVSARLSWQTQNHDGYGKNIVTGDGIDDKNSQAVRGQLLFKPTAKMRILVAGDYYHAADAAGGYHYFGAGGETASGAPVVPYGIAHGGFAAANPRDIATATNPKERATFYGGRIDASYELTDTITLRSISAYRHSDYTLFTTTTGLSISITDLKLLEKSNQYTQEFQFNVDSARNKFVAGLFYLHEKIDGAQSGFVNLIAFGGPNFDTQGLYAGGILKTDAAAAYAQDTYSVTDRLRFTLGGRYSWERKHVDDQTELDLSRPYGPGNLPLVPPHIDHATFKSFTPKVGIEFDLASRILLYASFSKGFKSGTFNLGDGGPALKPEKIEAYETGIKLTLLGGALRANLSGFYYNYSDLQVSKVEGPLLVLENAATARIYGAEGEFTVRPVADLTLGLNASWLHARFLDYITADQSRPGGDGVTIDPDTGVPAFNLRGKELSQSPNYTVDLSAEYAFHLASGTLTLRGESNWSDRVYFSAFNRDNVSQSAYNLQNAFATFEMKNGLSMTAFIKNIRNKTILASGVVASAGLYGSPIVGFVQPPRTYGVTVGYHF